MVKSFRPQSEFLKQYVRDFSSFEKGCDLRINFATFPHIGPAFAFLRNAELRIKPHHLQIDPTPADNFNSIIIGQYTRPVFITYSGYVDEISVNFMPLGINYFFDKPYGILAPENFQNLKDEKWLAFGRELVKAENIDEQLDMLEGFLIKIFRDPGLDMLQRAVDLLMDKEEEKKISAAAKAAGLSQRSLHRHFLKYMGCSPIVFKRIVRFRNAIASDSLKKAAPNLTRLGYDNLFYDSSHFAKEFKAFTGKNPGVFFRNVSFLGNSDYPYIFL